MTRIHLFEHSNTRTHTEPKIPSPVFCMDCETVATVRERGGILQALRRDGHFSAHDMTLTDAGETSHASLVRALIELFVGEGFEIKGAKGVDGYPPASAIPNDGYGSSRPHRADVVGFDPARRRIVFGLARPHRESLDSEESLEEYNVFLDHNAGLGDRASVLYIMMPEDLLAEFTSLITHYIHREYWHRVIPVGRGPS